MSQPDGAMTRPNGTYEPCPCPCHHDSDHCAICTNDYSDLCEPPSGSSDEGTS